MEYTLRQGSPSLAGSSVPHGSLRVRLRGHPFLLCVSSVFPVYSWFRVPLWMSVITQVELMRSRDFKAVESMFAHPRWEKTGTPEGEKCSHCCSAGQWYVGTWAGSSGEPLCCNFPYELTGGCFCFIFQLFEYLGLPLWKPLLHVQYLGHILPLPIVRRQQWYLPGDSLCSQYLVECFIQRTKYLYCFWLLQPFISFY